MPKLGVRFMGLVAAGLVLASCDSSDGLVGTDTLGSTDEFATGEGLIADRDSLPGAKLYAENCASCHDGSVPKAPHFQWLEMMSPASIVAALTNGVMAEQGAMLSEDDKLRVAEYITRVDLSDGLPEVRYAAKCEGPAARFDRAKPAIATGWGHDTRRFVPASLGGLEVGDIRDLELRWAYAFPNATKARSQPAIGYGAAFVGSDDGTVYAFDLESGCARWTFKASAEVRTGIVLADGTTPMLYFGDLTSKLYAVNALTGEEQWSRRMDDHPSATLTGTPAFHEGTLFVPVSSLEVVPAANPNYECCTFRGHLDAIDAKTGEVKWQFWAIPEEPKRTEKDGKASYAPSGAPMWTSPTIDAERGVLYAGTGENYSSPADGNSDSIFAIDLNTGRRAWHRQTISGDAWNVACMMEDNPNCPPERGPDFDHSSSPLLIDIGGGKQVLAVGHKNGMVYGLDPDANGKLLWETKIGRGSIQGGVHWGMAAEGTTVYVPINDMNNTRNGEPLDPKKARPGMHAVDARTGKKLWSQVQKDVCGDERPFCDPGVSAAVTAIPGAVIAGHMDGWIRAYDRKNGKRLWEFDSAKPFETVNNMPGRGGSMSGPGAAVGDGYVVINSGYGLYSHEAGNVLLVFAPKR
ncbi:PQQ-binding-like beta-propeller repeat protein [Altererythrobacter sp. MF3-039]|uniref:outer membrane protein assembly factor BamB family protein n=1 Tax=Altererythrobacter sp. MF3-039 TaxID=3252901 RepID=UPI00390C92B5